MMDQPQPHNYPQQHNYPQLQNFAQSQWQTNPVQTRPPRTLWPALVGTCVATALAASLATAGLTGAWDENAAPNSSIATTQTSQPTANIAQSSLTAPLNWQEVAAQVAPTVVAIDVVTRQGEGQGSGVVIDSEGYILTNNHVVEGARNNTVSVTLASGQIVDARIVGLDSTTDLALLQLNTVPQDLPAATLADSATVQPGAPVMAVGNPLGLANTVTTGVVSAVQRPVSAGNAQSVSVTNAIQIDAAINPGNSGGPLFNVQGEVIGITSSIATLSGSSSSGSIGLGFAIPSNLAQQIAEQLKANGVAEHAYLGVSLEDGRVEIGQVTKAGARITQVHADTPAAGAGIQAGDVVVAIDGDAVTGAESLTAFVRSYRSGQQVQLTVVRAGVQQDLLVTLASRAG